MADTVVNLLGVYGAGNDTAFGGGLRELQKLAKQKFGNRVYAPRIVDYTEYNTIIRLLKQWNDPTLLYLHSCGVMSGTAAAVENSMEKIPYICACAPSIYCSPRPLPPNVKRATQFTSNGWDLFNPGGRKLVTKSSINNVTVLDYVKTGSSHVKTPYSPLVQERWLAEIDLALR